MSQEIIAIALVILVVGFVVYRSLISKKKRRAKGQCGPGCGCS